MMMMMKNIHVCKGLINVQFKTAVKFNFAISLFHRAFFIQ